MKVKITRNVDIEDVPSLASEMLGPSELELDDVRGWLSNLVSELHNNKTTATMALHQIQRIKYSLEICQGALVDVESIMQGLADFERQQATTTPRPPAPSEAENTGRVEGVSEEMKPEVSDDLDLPF